MKSLYNLNITYSPENNSSYSTPRTPPLLTTNILPYRTTQSNELSFLSSPVLGEGERETIIPAPNNTPTQGTRQGMPTRILLSSARTDLNNIISGHKPNTTTPLIFEPKYIYQDPTSIKIVLNPDTGLYEYKDDFTTNTNNSSRSDQEPSGGFSTHEARSPSPLPIPEIRDGSPPLQFAFLNSSKRPRPSNDQ